MTQELSARVAPREEKFALGHLRPVAELQPGEREPAPGLLSLVQAFANTFWDLERGRPEQLVNPPALTRWLSAHALLDRGARLRAADLRRALDVREGLRSMLFFNNGAKEDREAVRRLNRALRGRGLFVQLDASKGPDFTARRRDLDGALASIATIVAMAQMDGRWAHLKACRGTDCGWTFYDHSRNQAGNWCAMSVCGSRAKARDYRRRRAERR